MPPLSSIRRYTASPRRAGVVALIVVAFVAGACRTQVSSEAPKEPVRGGTLVVGVAEIDMVNPGTSSGNTQVHTTMLVYQGLLFIDAGREPQPELAESFSVESDGAVYRFKLRKGVLWHDGIEFTADDVKFTFEKILLELHPRVRTVLRPKLEAIETPDPYTVVFRLKQPFGAFLQLMTVANTPILPKHIFEGTDPATNPANERPVGTGPFRFVSFQKKAELRLEANPDYYRKGIPYLGKVVYREIPDPSTLLQALESGEVDVAYQIEPSPDVVRIAKDSGFRLVRTNLDPACGSRGRIMGFNVNRTLFSDPKFRRAIAHGLDRRRMLKNILFDYGRVSDAPFAKAITWAYADDLDYPAYDKTKAAALLDQVGWILGAGGKRVARAVAGVEDGTPLRLDMVIRDDAVKFAEIAREDLAGLGIDLTISPASSELNAAKIYEKHDFDMYMTSQCQGTDPEIGVRRTIHSSGILPVANTNGAAYNNPEVDALLDEAAAEIDLGKRGKIYRQVQEILVQDMPYLWVVEYDFLGANVKSCSGIRYDSVHFAERAFCARAQS